MKCLNPRCNKVVPNNIAYCPYCGTTLPWRYLPVALAAVVIVVLIMSSVVLWALGAKGVGLFTAWWITSTPARTPMPTPTSTGTPTPTSTPTMTPTPTDTPTQIPVSQSVVVFRDDFDGPNLDMGKWVLDSISYFVAAGGGTLRTASSQSRYPYIYTRNNPFPTSGNFRINFRFRYSEVRTCGVGIIISSVLVPAGLSQDETARWMQEAEWNGVTAGVWQDDQQGLVIWFRSGNDRADRPYGGIDRDWHDIMVEYSESRYKIDLDGGRMYTSSTTPYRPRYVWIGHPADLRIQCSWDSLEVDYIQVESTQ